jgi:hypothetical protein
MSGLSGSFLYPKMKNKIKRDYLLTCLAHVRHVRDFEICRTSRTDPRKASVDHALKVSGSFKNSRTEPDKPDKTGCF